MFVLSDQNSIIGLLDECLFGDWEYTKTVIIGLELHMSTNCFEIYLMLLTSTYKQNIGQRTLKYRKEKCYWFRSQFHQD